MQKKSAFISFDFEHDKDLRGNLVAQAGRNDSPFSIVDRSLYEPFEEQWREQVRDLIRKADLTVVICGQHTHHASGVAAEVAIAREERKPYFLLRGRRQQQCSRPTTAPRKKKMHSWTWDNLKELMANPEQG